MDSVVDAAPDYPVLNFQGHVVTRHDDGFYYAKQGASIDFYIDGVYQMSFNKEETDKRLKQSFTTRDGELVSDPTLFPLVPWMSSRLWIGLWPAIFSFQTCSPNDITKELSFDEGEM